MINQILESAQNLPKEALYTIFLCVAFFGATGWSMYESINSKIEQTKKEMEQKDYERTKSINEQISEQDDKVNQLEQIAIKLSTSIESIKQDTTFIKKHYLQKGLEGG